MGILKGWVRYVVDKIENSGFGLSPAKLFSDGVRITVPESWGTLNGSLLILATHPNNAGIHDGYGVYDVTWKDRHGTFVRWTYSAEHLTFQAIETSDRVRSRDYRLRDFPASNGVHVTSRNSSYFAEDRVSLAGSFSDFDHKPVAAYAGSADNFLGKILRKQVRALSELADKLDDPEWKIDVEPDVRSSAPLVMGPAKVSIGHRQEDA